MHIAMHAFTRVDTGGGSPPSKTNKAWKLLGTTSILCVQYYTLGDRYIMLYLAS